MSLSYDQAKEAEPAVSHTITGFPPKVWVLEAFCSGPFPGEGGGAQQETTAW